jgi:hypothetical protein
MKASWPTSPGYLADTATQTTKAALGYTESDLYYFGNNDVEYGDDGEMPALAGMVFDTAGNIFASTGLDIKNDSGAIVELSPAGGGVWNESLVYVFDRRSPTFSGYGPGGALGIDSKGNIYGTTEFGGAYNPETGEYACGGTTGCGTVYELSKNSAGAWTATDLYDFGVNNTNDGFQPVAGVTLASTSATVLYGTTKCGGTSTATLAGCAGAGTIYELSKTKSGSWQETILYNFPATGTSEGSGVENDPNGVFPTAGLLLKSGKLYGTTSIGGINANGEAGVGTLFELSLGTGGWTIKQLYVFCTDNSEPNSCPEGGEPGAGTVAMDSKSNLYGTTGSLQLNEPSAVWELPYSSATESYANQVQVVYSEYQSPAPPGVGTWVIPYKNSLFTLVDTGTSGSYPYWSCCEELVELTNSTKGWQATTLYRFPSFGIGSGTNTLYGFSNQLIVDKSGNFYSMATNGGPYSNDGTSVGVGGVFEISPMP